MGRITETVKVLLIINVIFYIGSQVVGEQAYNLFALHYPQNDSFYPWQIITHMFMHDPSSITHIFFNMFLLYMFGSNLESILGRNRFLFLYFSAGLGATALQLLFQHIDFLPGFEAMVQLGESKETVLKNLNAGEYNPAVLEIISKDSITKTFQSFYGTAVGASGAIFGLLAAFAIMFPNLPLMIMFIPIPIKAKYLIGAYFLLNVYSAVSGNTLIGPENTAYWAHIGGAVIGFIVMWYWKKNGLRQY